MEIMIALTVSVLLGCGLFYWAASRRAGLQRKQQHQRETQIQQDLEQLKRELDDLVPALYQSDQASQRAVGIGINMALAFFRSRYPSTQSFAAVAPARKEEFLRKLGEAEHLFVEYNRTEAGIAMILLKCWLTALAEDDAKTAEAVWAHIDYFSKKPMEEYSEPIVTPVNERWAS